MDGLNLIKIASRLYGKSLPRILPLSIAFSVLIHLFQNGQAYFAKLTPNVNQISMFLIILSLPVLATYIVTIDFVSKKKVFTYGNVILLIIQRFVGFMATLLSMLLLPAIIFAIIMALHLIVLNKHMESINIYVYRSLLALAVLSGFISKIYAPVLVFTQQLDVNSAIEKSSTLVKGHFMETFFYSAVGVAFFTALLTFSMWIHWIVVIPQSMTLILKLIHPLLIVLFSSWPFALWITLLAKTIRQLKIKTT